MPYRVRHYYRQNPLAFKLAGAVLLVSTLVMLISILVFMVREYHQGMERMEQSLQQVELTALPGLSRSLWNFDEEQLRVQVNALLHLPDVAFASVKWTDRNGRSKSVGSSMVDLPKPLSIRELPLIYQRNDGTREPLGQLELGISHSTIYQYVGKQTVFLIVFLALQALVSAALIILLMRLLFTQRLSQLADDTRHLSLSSLRQPLPQPADDAPHDELDNIAVALNTMRERLLEDIETRRNIDRALLQERQLRLDNEERRIRAESANDAKSSFMATMSHEIRTPLNGIIGIIDLMQTSPLSNQQAHYLRLMQQSSENLLAIINDILDFSKIEAGELQLEHQPFNLATLIEDTMSAYAGLAHKKQLTLACELQLDRMQAVFGDEVRLRQILMNLINNALKFTEQGHVIIRARDKSQTDTGLSVHIEIEDSGIGISDSHQEVIFQAFAQADQSTARRFGGTGLGLSVCRSLCSLMNGTLGVSSTLGQGARFWLDLPLQPQEKQPPLPQLPKASILILSHDLPLRQTLSRMLEHAGGTTLQGDTINLLSLPGPFSHALIDETLLGAAGLSAIPPDTQARILLIGDLHEESDAVPVLRKPVTRSALFLALAPDSGHETAASKPSQAPALDQLQVLVAEDNSVNRDVLRALLGSLGITPLICENGHEAVQAYCQHPTPLDLILMDVEMPELDGLAATQAIRQFERDTEKAPCPIIAITAHALGSQITRIHDAGIDRILNKPIRRDTLLQCLQELASPLTHRDQDA